MSMEENKALIRKFLDELYNNGNFSVADEIIASPMLRESMKKAVSTARRMLSNVQVKVEDMVAENDKVVARCLISGTFTRSLLGVTLTNRSIETSYIGIYRIDNNQIKGYWFLGEPLLLMRQMGIWTFVLFFAGAFR